MAVRRPTFEENYAKTAGVSDARNNAMIASANQQRARQGLAPVSYSAANTGAALNFRTNTLADTQRAAAQRAPTVATRPVVRSTGSGGGGGGGGGRGGGGGGGGAAAPTMNQGQLDWVTNLLRGGTPANVTANTLDLPDYQGMAVRAFDPSMFNQARTAWGEGVQQDLGTANKATADMLGFLNQNYTNAFNNPNQTYAQAGQAPGMSGQAMGRFLQGQGVNPQMAAQTQNEGVQADQAFGNVWRSMAGNEDIMQRARLANAQQYGNQATQGIQAAGRAGTLGIDLGQGQAQSAWQQRADERAYQDYQQQQQVLQQEAMQNWQRGNQVQDLNTTNQNQYRNSELQALLGLLPQMIQSPNLNLPQNFFTGG